MGLFSWLSGKKHSAQAAAPPNTKSEQHRVKPTVTVESSTAAKTAAPARLSMSPSEFVARAVTGPARCTVPISEAGQVAASLAKALGDAGISSSSIIELLPYGLLGVCPRCNQYCAGQGLLMLSTFSMMRNVTFTGNSGGAERMMEGKCLNYSCENTTFDLFWCPDLDPVMLSNLRSRGINIDPNTQRQRDRFWKPSAQ